jgi:hypothetical protein
MTINMTIIQAALAAMPAIAPVEKFIVFAVEEFEVLGASACRRLLAVGELNRKFWSPAPQSAVGIT